MGGETDKFNPGDQVEILDRDFILDDRFDYGDKVTIVKKSEETNNSGKILYDVKKGEIELIFYEGFLELVEPKLPENYIIVCRSESEQQAIINEYGYEYGGKFNGDNYCFWVDLGMMNSHQGQPTDYDTALDYAQNTYPYTTIIEASDILSGKARNPISDIPGVCLTGVAPTSDMSPLDSCTHTYASSDSEELEQEVSEFERGLQKFNETVNAT